MNTQEQLARYLAVFEASRVRAEEITAPLAGAQFNWKPTATQWSVGECLDHLNRVARGYVPALGVAVRSAPIDHDGRVSYGWPSRLFIAAVTPGSRAVKTFGDMKPAPTSAALSSLDKEATLTEFVSLTNGYIEVCRRAEGVDIGRAKMRSPFLRFLRLPLGAFMDALGQHALRHLDQAENVTRLPGFPE